MNKLTQVALLAALGLGLGVGFWGGRKVGHLVPAGATGTTGAQTYIQLLQQQLVDALSQVKKTTAQSNRELGVLNKTYQDSLARLHRLESQQLGVYRNARTAGDSLAACSVVLLTCEQRADLAEGREKSVRAQLARQTALQPHPCGIIVVGGPIAGVQLGKKLSAFALPAQLGITTGCRIPLPFIH